MGNGTRRKKLAFFYEVDEFLSGNPCSKPKVVFNPSQIVIADGTEDSEEESKGNVENVEPGLPFNNSNNKARKFRTLKRFLCDMYRWDFKKENIAYWKKNRLYLKRVKHSTVVLWHWWHLWPRQWRARQWSQATRHGLLCFWQSSLGSFSQIYFQD